MGRIMRMATIVLLIMGLAAELGAQMHGRGRGHRPGCGLEREGFCFGDQDFLRKKLRLSEEQIRTVAGINREFANKLQDLKERMVPFERELRGLLMADELDLEKVRATLERIAGVEIEMRMTRIRHRLAIEKVLTNEQRERHRREMKNRRPTDD